MKFQKRLVHGRLIRRYKRFLADVELDNGQKVIAHCTNSGSMKTCLQEGAEVYMTPVKDPNRKTRFTWEMIKIRGSWVGINTNVPNKLAYEAVQNGAINRLKGYDQVQSEVTYGDSRLDLYLENDDEKCFVEVKNVTMKSGKYGLFPDAVTKRGKKHLQSLMRVKNEGMRAVMLYVVQRTDVEIFGPALEIDPEYSETLKEAYEHGVEIIPMQTKVTPTRIELLREMPFELE
ncbi:MAG: DNA/RNA nuclease SfsA [Bacteroidales bacterium]|nr:DNA/RNA nuclease SfsA [Bacteroidales bacterium]